MPRIISCFFGHDYLAEGEQKMDYLGQQQGERGERINDK